MDFNKGKNFTLINKFGISHDLEHGNKNHSFPVRIFGKFDLDVEGVTESPEDFWMVVKDLDGELFAQPISGHVLAEKLMTSAFVPVKKREQKESPKKSPKQMADFFKKNVLPALKESSEQLEKLYEKALSFEETDATEDNPLNRNKIARESIEKNGATRSQEWQEELDDFKEVPNQKTPHYISEFPMSTRLKVCLLHADLLTIEELVDLSEEDLRNIRNIGELGLKEVQEIIFSFKNED